MLNITEHIRIPTSEFTFKYARSSGKGGQNVNKVNSKAILTWNPAASVLPEDVKTRFFRKYGHRISEDGLFQIQSERFRDQPRNAEDCLEKLKDMLISVAVPPKKRKATKPTKSSRFKRLDSKRRHSEKKRRRQDIDS